MGCSNCGESNDDPYDITTVPVDVAPHYQPYEETQLVPIQIAKPKPPLENLNSFNCNAEILAFFGYQHEVRVLISSLSHNSRAFYEGHKEILDGFVKTNFALIKQPLFTLDVED